jgi:hypothetical protein
LHFAPDAGAQILKPAASRRGRQATTQQRKSAHMKNPTQTNPVIRFSLALALALAIWSPLQTRAAEPADGKCMTDGKMKECCKEMKEQKEHLMAECKAQDAELATQVAEMNSAPEDKKLGLMAAIITRLVEQRAVMNAHMGMMQEKMMKHMMHHMEMGKDSVSKCPMMKDTDDKPGEAEKAQK